MFLADVSAGVTITVALITGILTGALSGIGAALISSRSAERQHNLDLKEKAFEWLREQRLTAYAAIAPAINAVITEAEAAANAGFTSVEKWEVPTLDGKQTTFLAALQSLRNAFSVVSLVEPAECKDQTRKVLGCTVSYVNHLVGLPTNGPVPALAVLQREVTTLSSSLSGDIHALGEGPRPKKTEWREEGANELPLSGPVEMTSSPAAGWYSDPSAPKSQRWWDGRQWTHETRSS